jgi:hypothetical protein
MHFKPKDNVIVSGVGRTEHCRLGVEKLRFGVIHKKVGPISFILQILNL